MARYGASDNTTVASVITDHSLSSFVMPEDGTLDSIVAYVGQKFSNPNYSLELYEGGTGAGNPTGATLVFSSGEQVTPAVDAWVTETAGGESLTSGTRYWIVVRGDGATDISRVASPDHGDLELGSPSGLYTNTGLNAVGTAADDPFPSGSSAQSYTNTIKAAINYSTSSGQTDVNFQGTGRGILRGVGRGIG